MGSGFSKKKKQAKMMQEQFQQMQEELKALKVTGNAGNGLVTLTINGDQELLNINIDPQCVDPDDIEGLQDLIMAAHKDANAKLKKEQSGTMPGLPPGLSGMLGGF